MKKKFLTLLAFVCGLNGMKADEGMWMLSHISPKSMKVMKDLGLQMSEKELYNTKGTSLKDAVVSFGGFCSGVVVSPDGLVFTNHHCGFGNIQALATPENDILKNGFVARTQAEELPAKGLYVQILQRTEDITKRVNKALDKYYKEHAAEMAKLGENAKEKMRWNSVDSICLAIENEYAKKYPELICEVSPYYTGNAFYVNVYKQYDDIRLVFAPPQSLGKFGGETDNWMWPRQTCDFSVFRIYADKDNQPAEYSADNRPLKAERYAKVSLEGFKKGDRTNIEIPKVQQEMVKALKATGKPVVYVLCTGSALALNWEDANIDAILEENQQLSEENAALRSQMVDYDKLKAENEAYKALANIQEQHPEMSYTSSFVIGRDPLDSFWGFTLDRGTLDGVAVNDAVISDEGYLLGVVREADLTSCKVMTILHPSFNAAGVVSRTRDNGIITGSADYAADGLCILSNLARSTLSRDGDQVITTGLGGVFPPDVLVGVIKELTPEASGKSTLAVIQPGADPRTVRHVFIITNY